MNSALALRGLYLEQPLAGLAQRDGQRLLLNARLDERSDVLEQTLTELGVVGVDLARALRRHDHEPVLAVNDIQELVDRGIDDAVSRRGPAHVSPSRVIAVKQRYH